MKQQALILLIVLVTSVFVNAQEKEVVVPYTLADRDRMVRIETRMDALETKMDALETKMDVRFEAIQKQFDGIQGQFEGIQGQFEGIQRQLDNQQSFMYWIAGLLVLMFGYLIWDRRTAMSPIREKSVETENKLNNLLNALRELARTDTELSKLLRSHGLL